MRLAVQTLPNSRRFDARQHATLKRSVRRALTMMPMGAGSDSAFRQIVSAIVSSTGQGIVDAPTRIYLRRRGRSHWDSLIPTAHRIRTATREGAPRRRTDGVVRERCGDYFAAFVEELARLGWTEGRSVRIELRWTQGDPSRASAFATELIGLQPDVIFCSSTAVTTVLHRATSTIPIVFAIVSDPLGSGLVASLSHPGGNITGFICGGRYRRQVAQSAKRKWRLASNVPRSCSIPIPRRAAEKISWPRSRLPLDP